jgi:hypothetical protein
MAYFQNKNPDLGKIWEGRAMKDVGILYGYSVYLATIWSIWRLFGTFYGHLVHYMVIRYIFPRFGMLCQDKSGNPARQANPFRPG